MTSVGTSRRAKSLRKSSCHVGTQGRLAVADAPVALPISQYNLWRARLACHLTKNQRLRLVLTHSRFWPSPCRYSRREAFVMVRSRVANRRTEFHAGFASGRTGSLLEIKASIPSEINAISPLVGRMMRLTEGAHCVAGEEYAVELALREALKRRRPWQPAECSQISTHPLPLQGWEGNFASRLRGR
jgi:hypothetical protein